MEFSSEQKALFAFIRQKLHVEVANEEAANAKVGEHNFPEDIANALGIRGKAYEKTESGTQSFVNELHEMLQIPDLTLKQATIYHITRWRFSYTIDFYHDFAHLVLALADIHHYQNNEEIEQSGAQPLGVITRLAENYAKAEDVDKKEIFVDTAKKTLLTEFQDLSESEQIAFLEKTEKIFEAIKPLVDIVTDLRTQTSHIDFKDMPFRDFVKAASMEVKLPPLLTVGAADKNLSHVPTPECERKP